MTNFFQKLTRGEEDHVTGGHDPVDLSQLKPEKERIPRHMYTPAHMEKEHHVELVSEEGDEESMPDEGELTVDIYDKGDAIVLHSTVAGVKPEDLDVAITNDTVTVRGKRHCPDKIDEKDYYYKEVFWGGFSRSVLLPEEIEKDTAEATLKYGLLTIRLPKKRHGVVQKVKVKVI